MTLATLMQKGIKEARRRGLVQGKGQALVEGRACMLGVLALGVNPSITILSTGGAVNTIAIVSPNIKDAAKNPVSQNWQALYCVLYDLNDNYEWTFEQGLEWLQAQNL